MSNLTKSYGRKAWLGKGGSKKTVLQDFKMNLMPGETIAIVGESGSGKSTVARCLTRLIDADDGKVMITGEEFSALSSKMLRRARSRIQMIFQDTYSSLNPRSTAGSIVSDPAVARGVARREAWEQGRRLLQMVGLDQNSVGRLPHEFSGGQRQRIGIARALSVEPDILIADEAVSALDISTQAQIIKLFDDLQRQLGVAIIFITHDLRLARKIAHRIVVMKSGEIVEQGRTTDIFENPKHPYTIELLNAIPGKRWLEGDDGLDRNEWRAPANVVN